MRIRSCGRRLPKSGSKHWTQFNSYPVQFADKNTFKAFQTLETRFTYQVFTTHYDREREKIRYLKVYVASTCFQPATQTHPKRSTNASELCTSFFLKKSEKHFKFRVKYYRYHTYGTVPVYTVPVLIYSHSIPN